MSGILAVVSRTSDPPDDVRLTEMLTRMRGRGAEISVQRTADGIVATCRHSWEGGHAFGRRAGLTTDGDLVVVADASLYYRAELVRQLASTGVTADPNAAPCELILAAFRAWGAGCAERLEGDFAFLVWDRVRGVVVGARDFAGRRPLFFADLGDTLVAASTLDAVLAHPRVPQALDLGALGAAAAGLFAGGAETCYQAVHVLPAGRLLRWEPGRTGLERFWSPPAIEARVDPRGPGFAEAAEELRGLLIEAVAERLDDGRPSSVWMSGGWDSTAVFGAGNAALRESGSASVLRPISVSYPVGDPGREDELIEQVAARWNTPIHWLDIRDIPLLESPVERAASRAEPFAHTYEMWVRTLASGSRATGCRVALDGIGGDQLFQVSPVYLADLFSSGRWRALRREARAKGLTTARGLARWALLPHLPVPLRLAISALRGGRAVPYYLERPLPTWMRRDFLRRHGVTERERRNTPRRRGGSHAAYETHWYLTHPYAARILSCVSSLALEEGVELRSPLYDQRIVRFAASRPWNERSLGRETKRLLREAMRGLLPDAVLAPRASRTGLMSGFLASSLRHRHTDFISETLREPILAEVGMVDAKRLSHSWEEYRRSGDENLAISLLFTIQTELWLRARCQSTRR